MERTDRPTPLRAARALVAFTLLLAFAASARAQTTPTTFTYQGRLEESGVPLTGARDFEFKLYDGAGAQVGATVTVEDVSVDGGAFTVYLDFGNVFDGAERRLEIGVRPGASVGAFTTLAPRQPITATPYAIRSLSAAEADDALKLGGTDAARFVQSDAAGNVSVGGDLSVGGTFSTNIVDAQTQYNLGGQRMLSNAGSQNTFLGINAGSVNSGRDNTFVGTSAGGQNTAGNINSFFGTNAGLNNRTGNNNSFFGGAAGLSNNGGSNNSFF